MYAVIETGGKQYRVELGSELAVERLDNAPGETVEFGRVLLVVDGGAAQIGTPVVADALVTGEIVRQDRGEKIVVFKYRPKARHRAKKGHRQEQTVVRVADIRFNGRSAADEASAEQKAAAKSRKAAVEAAEKKAAADRALADKLAADAAKAEETADAKATAKAAGTRAAKTKADAAETKPAAKSTAKPKTVKAEAKPTASKSEPKATKTKSARQPKKATQSVSESEDSAAEPQED